MVEVVSRVVVSARKVMSVVNTVVGLVWRVVVMVRMVSRTESGGREGDGGCQDGRLRYEYRQRQAVRDSLFTTKVLKPLDQMRVRAAGLLSRSFACTLIGRG